MSALQVYMVLQMDSIGSMFAVFAFMAFVAGFILAFIASCMEDEGQHDNAKRQLYNSMKCVAVMVICTAFAFLIPSTKSLASMILVPRLAESVAVQKDLPEIYSLAMGALKKTLSEAAKVEKD